MSAELIAAIHLVRNPRTVVGLKPFQIVPVRVLSNRGNLVQVLKQGKAEIMVLTKAKTAQLMTSS